MDAWNQLIYCRIIAVEARRYGGELSAELAKAAGRRADEIKSIVTQSNDK